MIRAIIVDFNGLIADDETPHLRCFQQALSEHGLSLTKEKDYGTYLCHIAPHCTRPYLSSSSSTNSPPHTSLCCSLASSSL